MEETSTSTQKNDKHQSLLDIMFSWTLHDVLNHKLYKDKVQKIPLSFSSTKEYLNSFIFPLIEETHSDLCSGIEGVSQAPFCEVMTIQRSKDFKPPKALFYKMRVKKVTEEVQNVGKYEPEFGDIVAFTDVRPKGIYDLNRPKMQYHIAFICGSEDEFTDEIEVLSSKCLDMDFEFSGNINETQKLYVVYLLNMTTNIRIWRALNVGEKMNIIEKVLQHEPNSNIEEVCQICCSGESMTQSPAQSSAQIIIRAQNLNESQRDSVLSCVAMSKCHYSHNVKLIWGPPGTGKTKTVACLLYSLLREKIRTLTCAPTNNAVLTVASRLHSLFKQSQKFDTYGLGNILLFGNKNRMKVDNFPGLEDVFLDYRVEELLKCFMPLTGWKHHLELMIKLLKNPNQQYRCELNDKEDLMSLEEFAKKSDSNVKRAYSSYKRKVKSSNLLTFEQFVEKKFDGIVESYNLYVEDKKMSTSGMTMEQFVKQRFSYIGGRLKLFMKALYTHLPTSMISFKVVKKMFIALNLLKSLETSLRNTKFKRDFHQCKDGKSLQSILSSLSRSISLPWITSKHGVSMFCIEKACLVFCTASSSSKLHTQEGDMFRFVVIDEAAQLRECESATVILKYCKLDSLLDLHEYDEGIMYKLMQDSNMESIHILSACSVRWLQIGRCEFSQSLRMLTCDYPVHPDQYDDRVKEHLRFIAFYHASQIRIVQCQKGLVNALVERWYPDTHTFYLPIGECAEDMAMILGLPTDGLPVTGMTMSSFEALEAECLHQFEVAPRKSNCRGSGIKLTWLRDLKERLQLTDENNIQSIGQYSWGRLASHTCTGRYAGHLVLTVRRLTVR
ncbi:uncharacterized protein LOC107606814 [Arachis ipaensis]|uniref:uncharacterized protein LOC107606814 n=1 Tax=Arachis ipaensis TaxID=130454 RepID=UPI0007AF8A56|nr:uncharacterized protein LOC107606814 [Arachis ipaensis]